MCAPQVQDPQTVLQLPLGCYPKRLSVLCKLFFFSSQQLRLMLCQKLNIWMSLWLSDVRWQSTTRAWIFIPTQRGPYLARVPPLPIGNTVTFKCIKQLFEDRISFWEKSQENATVFVAKNTIMFLESKLEKFILRYRKEGSSGLPQLPRHVRIKWEQWNLPEREGEDENHILPVTWAAIRLTWPRIHVRHPSWI